MTFLYPRIHFFYNRCYFVPPTKFHSGTEAQWAALLEESGFKIVQIYHHGLGAESVIEAEIV